MKPGIRPYPQLSLCALWFNVGFGDFLLMFAAKYPEKFVRKYLQK